MSLTNLLSWLTGADGGAFLLISWAVSWGLNDVAWWNGLKAQTKALIILSGSGVMGAGAAALQANPEVVPAIEPFVRPLIFAVMAWLGTQVAHRGTKSLEAKLTEAKASTVEAKASVTQAKAQAELAEAAAPEAVEA